MPNITDLTGTTWVIRDDAVMGLSSTNSTYTLNFSSYSNNYTSLTLYGTTGLPSDTKYKILYNSTQVYGGALGWFDINYRTIEITGGTDVTNATLISWLEANATQVTPSADVTFDLTTLQLASGTYAITVKAKATGYTDSAASNSVSYTVASSASHATTSSGERLTTANGDVLTLS